MTPEKVPEPLRKPVLLKFEPYTVMSPPLASRSKPAKPGVPEMPVPRLPRMNVPPVTVTVEPVWATMALPP